jgi:hypothetical protein
MKVNFDNVRLQACYAYDKLVSALNASEEYEGYMLVNPNNIEKHLRDLRFMIATIAMCYGNEEVKNVFPEDYTMQSFSFESEEP